jgi:hypothetical protein
MNVEFRGDRQAAGGAAGADSEGDGFEQHGGDVAGGSGVEVEDRGRGLSALDAVLIAELMSASARVVGGSGRLRVRATRRERARAGPWSVRAAESRLRCPRPRQGPTAPRIWPRGIVGDDGLRVGPTRDALPDLSGEQIRLSGRHDLRSRRTRKRRACYRTGAEGRISHLKHR